MGETGMKNEVSVTVGGFAFALWLFVFFWAQSGWYRVDCAMQIEKACELIKTEYALKEKP